MGSAGKFRRGRKCDRSPQRNTNKRENLAHWRYIFFACKRIRVNNLNHFCMSLFSNLHKAFPRQFVGPFDSRGHTEAAAMAGPPGAPARLCSLGVTDALRSRTLADAKLIDILENQPAVFMIQQL